MHKITDLVVNGLFVLCIISLRLKYLHIKMNLYFLLYAINLHLAHTNVKLATAPIYSILQCRSSAHRPKFDVSEMNGPFGGRESSVTTFICE